MRIESAVQRIASGYQINRASDNAAGLSINERLKALAQGIDKGTQNANQSTDALLTAEGAIGQISDSLTRIRELALQSSSGILTDSDRNVIQGEIEALKSNINDISSHTSFNTRRLLDGTFQNQATATQANGSGSTLSIGNMTTEALGISQFDIRGGLQLESLDQAITKVNQARGQTGADSNALASTIRSNEQARESALSTSSRLAGADIQQEMIRYSQASILKQYQQQMQALNQETEKNKISFHF